LNKELKKNESFLNKELKNMKVSNFIKVIVLFKTI